MSDEGKKAVIVGRLNDYEELIKRGSTSVRAFILEVARDERILEELCEYELYDDGEEGRESQELGEIIEFIRRGSFDDKALEHFFDVLQHQRSITTKMLGCELNEKRVR